MEEGEASAGSGGGPHSESAGLVSDDLQDREDPADAVLNDRIFEEALFAGDATEYEAGFVRSGEEGLVAEPDESAFIPKWTQSSSRSSMHADFPGYGSQAVDDSYSHEARALIDAHDAADEERRAAELCAEVEPPRADPKSESLKAAAIFGRMYGEIFGDTEGDRQDTSARIDAGIQEPVNEEVMPKASDPLIKTPPGYMAGVHRPARGAFRDISDYDASGFGSMEEFEDVPANEVQPIAFRGLRWIRRNVGNLKVTVSLQRGAPPPPPRDRKPQS